MEKAFKTSVEFHYRSKSATRPRDEADNDDPLEWEGNVAIPNVGDLVTYRGGEYPDGTLTTYRHVARMRKVESRLFYVRAEEIHVYIVVTDLDEGELLRKLKQ